MHATFEVHILGSIRGGEGVVGDGWSVWWGGRRRRVFKVLVWPGRCPWPRNHSGL